MPPMTLTPDRSSFCGDRLRVARVFNGLSQAELGARIEVTHASISQVENGLRFPSDTVVERLSAALGFAPGFFFSPVKSEFREEECHFRRRKTAPVTVRSRVLSTGTLFVELLDVLERSVNLPAYNVPTIRAEAPEEIEAAAEKVRGLWGLGTNAPIKNVARALERAGIVIARFEASTGKIDAFSRHGARGIIVLNTDKECISRARFDKSHEAGHLVLHAGLDHSEEEESQADRFASAFLMPRRAFAAEFPRFTGPVRLESLIPLKERWRASIAAMVRRAHDLRLVSAAQYQAAYKQYSARGWARAGEPAEPPDEAPEVVPLAFSVLEQQGVSKAEVLRKLAWTPRILSRVAPDVLPPQEPEGGNIIPFPQIKMRRRIRP